MAVGSCKGAGSGTGLQQGMLVGAKAAVNLGMQDIKHIEMLVLSSGGIGVDRRRRSAGADSRRRLPLDTSTGTCSHTVRIIWAEAVPDEPARLI